MQLAHLILVVQDLKLTLLGPTLNDHVESADDLVSALDAIV